MQSVAGGLVFVVDGGLVFVVPEDLLDKGQQLLLVHLLQLQFILQEDRVLGAVVHKVVRRSLFPPVEDWFMSPLVVAPAHDKGVLLPDQALR